MRWSAHLSDQKIFKTPHRTAVGYSVKDSTLDQAALERMGAYHASDPRTLDPIDIANAVLFLASDEARPLNGAVLPVDMGWTAA
ncbi:SDR family oxidoreductase [Devosia psychrophila]|uniref:Enoyl-(Acyl carrier protein) reductase n=1 Tax=Devosia psychrophila TaxID=728005 RepID=A0A0F5Q109_9HYPH|nr:SDR family oxidoreductase [Devosia psychrophila]KKC34545.1 hypothetical protein WH91_02280 [Devosia psychrophila]SFD35860.1 hypothetical protein SAMN04488059_1458 [Devosia psychrophila]